VPRSLSGHPFACRAVYRPYPPLNTTDIMTLSGRALFSAAMHIDPDAIEPGWFNAVGNCSAFLRFKPLKAEAFCAVIP
jgi:hypothetical protein